MDEQALARHVAPAERRLRGAYFTPAELVDRVLDAVEQYLPRKPLTFVDPACGAGAFLARAAERFPRAKLVGMELDAESLALARSRVPQAKLIHGDGLATPVTVSGFQAWIGNPPYNGTSPVLKDSARWARLVEGVPQLRGQSLREDYAFFLLRALEALKQSGGVLAFVTSATLLDSWAHAPLRKLLSEELALREVHPLGRGVFRNTRVSTCFTVFTTLGEGIRPAAPEYLFSEVDEAAERIDAAGTRLSKLVPISFAGLKTRFDELLVDDDRENLIARMKRFCAGRKIELPDSPKLRALPRVPFDQSAVRRFIHPLGPRRWCYLDRRLIPRGDHRFQGEWDPHACDVKLVFNHRELPLHAQVLDEPGCVTAYRHTRFAPLMVPEPVLRGEKKSGRLVPVSTREQFEKIARWIAGDEIQKVWAPVFGTTRDVPIQM